MKKQSIQKYKTKYTQMEIFNVAEKKNTIIIKDSISH